MSRCLMLLVVVSLQISTAGEASEWQHLPPNVPPALGCWFWHDGDLAPDHYKAYVDMIAKNTGFTVLTASLRFTEGELTDAPVHDALADAAEYAAGFGITTALDLDVRLAREAFQRDYPGEMQEMLRVREAARTADGDTVFEIAPEKLSDHYTAHTKKVYDPLASRLVRAYAFSRTDAGIDPASVADITAACQVVENSPNIIRVAVPASATALPVVCVCVAFSHLTPDVFAPHLFAFQRDLLERYKDAHLAGACKDEWGFPPCFDGTPEHNDFWYSEAMAEAYLERTGRDLVRDCLLMYTNEAGREGDRQGAINRFMELCRARNVAVEEDFYQGVKAVFGTEAMVSTHPTWYPYCDRREFKKNGLDWWEAHRDYAQTDEVTPFCVRTALAKRWNGSVWYNMFYAPEKREYEFNVWSCALAGGRINYHPLYPLKEAPGWSMADLFTGDLMRGEARVRLLNFITPAPLDCRVAVVFGHACAMNWAGPSYEDVGLTLVNGLWRAGYYTDLIPSSEIEAGALQIADGKVAYGPQLYDVVVLHRPEFERPAVAQFFTAAAGAGGTALRVVGDWSRDFDGAPFDGNAALPAAMTRHADSAACLEALLGELPKTMEAETPAIENVCWNTNVVQPPASGQVRLLDGTRIAVAGENDPAGDPLQIVFDIEGHTAAFDAVGLAAVRLASDGTVEAMAAGGLKRFEAEGMLLELAEPCDVVVVRNGAGGYRGFVQGCAGEIPASLTALTSQWDRIVPPAPLVK